MNKKFYKILPIASLFLLVGCSDGVPIFKKHCTLKFKPNGGQMASTEQKIDIFTVPDEPADPVKDNYDFLGWYYDNNTFNYRFNFEQKLCQDVTLYAKWGEPSRVNFTSNTLYTNEMTSPTGYDYIAQIRLRSEYSDNFTIPTEKAYYAVRINGELYDDFSLLVTHESSEDRVRLAIPAAAITGPISIQVEAYEKYLSFINASDDSVTLKNQGSGVAPTFTCREIDIATGEKKDITWVTSSSYTLESNKKLQILTSNLSTLSESSTKWFGFATESGSLGVAGNVASIINYAQLTDYCFYHLFNDFNFSSCNVALPYATLANNCYQGMFEGSKGFNIAPILPAETIEHYAYESMFKNCTDLAMADIAARTLKSNSLANMFSGCTNIYGIRVKFGTANSTDWPNATDATKDWLPSRNPTIEPIFNWKGTTDIYAVEKSLIGNSRIPSGWLVANIY